MLGQSPDTLITRTTQRVAVYCTPVILMHSSTQPVHTLGSADVDVLIGRGDEPADGLHLY